MSRSYWTSVSGCLDGGRQLDAVIHPLGVTDPACLAALDSLLHQETENITGVLGTCAVPLHTAQHTAATHEGNVIETDFWKWSRFSQSIGQFQHLLKLIDTEKKKNMVKNKVKI